MPVSYTHLDVYKRQSRYLPFRRNYTGSNRNRHFQNRSGGIYFLSGNPGYVRSESVKAGKIRLYIHFSGTGAFAYRYGGFFPGIPYRSEISDGIY